ncbi:MAG: hypothetical protein ACLR7J_03630 [[Ruminococcus] torques]
MQKKIRKIVSSILASCMVISAFAGIAPQKAEARQRLSMLPLMAKQAQKAVKTESM